MTSPGTAVDRADAGRLLATRGVRALVDGAVATVLPAYLLARGLRPSQVGAVITATLLGSAAVTLGVGLRGGHLDRVRLLQAIAVAMVLTGIGFGLSGSFVVLLIVATLGTINPSGGDVERVPADRAVAAAGDGGDPPAHPPVRPLLAGGGSCRSGGRSGARRFPRLVADRTGVSELDALRSVFFVYAGAGGVLLVLYARLRPRPPAPLAPGARRGLDRSRAVVLRLAALFSIDAFGGGFAGQSILVLWLAPALRPVHRRRRRGVLLERAAVGQLGAPGAPAGRSHRAHPHDGLHPPAGQRPPHGGGAHADRAPGRGMPAGPVAAVADGRPGPHLLRHGRGGPGGAGRGRQRHQRAPQPRVRAAAAGGRLAARALELRLAAPPRPAA